MKLRVEGESLSIQKQGGSKNPTCESGSWATSAILMRMMKTGGGKQLALSRYLLRASSGSIHLETDSWNFWQQPTFLPPWGRSSADRKGLPSRSTGKGSCCSRSISSIAAPNLPQKAQAKRDNLECSPLPQEQILHIWLLRTILHHK